MTCPTYDPHAVHRYVAGTLSAYELERFEQHLLECAHCRAAVRFGAAVRSELVAVPARRTVPAKATGIAIALAAASIAVVFALRRDDPVRRLAEFAPPPFVGAAVRAPADSVSARVDRGMTAYARGDFRRAARELAAASAHDSSASVAFYLGVSLLMRGDARAALPALRSAEGAPGNPYRDDARFLEARAWLQLGRADSALAALNAERFSNESAKLRARALADSIRLAIR